MIVLRHTDERNDVLYYEPSRRQCSSTEVWNAEQTVLNKIIRATAKPASMLQDTSCYKIPLVTCLLTAGAGHRVSCSGRKRILKEEYE